MVQSKRTPTGLLQQASLTSETALLNALVDVPPDANSAVVTTNQGTKPFRFRLDGHEGSASAMLAFKLKLPSREMIAACVLRDGDTTVVNVQFFTGRTGITE